MTWHHSLVRTDHLAGLLARIRRTGGTVTSCTPRTGGVLVTWTTRG